MERCNDVLQHCLILSFLVLIPDVILFTGFEKNILACHNTYLICRQSCIIWFHGICSLKIESCCYIPVHSLHSVLSSDSIDFVHHKSKNVINARTSMIDWLIDLFITSQRLIANVINGPSFKEPNLLIEKTCTFEATVVCWANGSFMVRHYPKLQSAWSKSFMGNWDPWPALRASNPMHLPIGMPKYLKLYILKLGQNNVVFQSIADTRTPCRAWKATNPWWRRATRSKICQNLS